MMRVAGLAMIALGLFGIAVSLVDWRTADVGREGVELASDGASTEPVDAGPGSDGQAAQLEVEMAEVDAAAGPAADSGESLSSDREEASNEPSESAQGTFVARAEERADTPSETEDARSVPEATPARELAGVPANVKVFERDYRDDQPAAPLLAEIAARSEIVDEGSGYADFRVTLSEPAERSVVIIFSTLDLSAKDREDYQSQRGTVTFEPGVMSADIRTPLVDDDVKEEDEQFAIILNGAPGIVSFKSRRVTATIRDDD